MLQAPSTSSPPLSLAAAQRCGSEAFCAGDYDRAQACLQAALEAAPHSAAAHLLLGKVLLLRALAAGDTAALQQVQNEWVVAKQQAKSFAEATEAARLLGLLAL